MSFSSFRNFEKDSFNGGPQKILPKSFISSVLIPNLFNAYCADAAVPSTVLTKVPSKSKKTYLYLIFQLYS